MSPIFDIFCMPLGYLLLNTCLGMTTIVEPLLDIESASIMRSINYDVTINRAEHKLFRYTHLAALIWGAFPFIFKRFCYY